ncbi:MAG: chemotaxis protein CheW, partial [Rhodospirillales bacterium]|nr:chemotaxis protein CheW [Rhodospirillales bacterium]
GELVHVVHLITLLNSADWEECRNFVPRDSGTGRRVTETRATRRFLTFLVGEEMCAVDLDRIDRVAEKSNIADLPGGGLGRIIGMVDVGGSITPVVDLRRALGVENRPDGDCALVVVHVDSYRWALVVDSLDRILDIPVATIEAVASSGDGFVSQIGRLDGRLISILTLDPLREAA